MFPQVTVSQINTSRGGTKQIARTVLFLNKAAKPIAPTPVNAKTDLNKIAAANDKLKSTVNAFFANAGQNASAWIMQVVAEDASKKWITDAVLAAQQVLSVEGVVVVNEVTEKEIINDVAALRDKLINGYSRWVWFILSCRGITKASETWPVYIQAMTELQKGIAAPAVQLVPQLFGNESGVLAGRLCNNAVTLADTPARVATGAIKMPGDMPSDSEGSLLDLATIRALNEARFSVPAWYEDFDGIFWADGVTLESPGGDYQAIEYLRVVDEVARRVRVMAIAKIGDRSFNSTPVSIAAHKQIFSRPMRQMSRSMRIGGVFFPGECMPPDDNSVEISWESKNSVRIALLVRPYNCPKQITVSIILDLSEDK